MCEYSQQVATELSYKAMQFNFLVLKLMTPLLDQTTSPLDPVAQYQAIMD